MQHDGNEMETQRPLPGETGPCRYVGCTKPAFLGAARCPGHGGKTEPRLPAVTDALLALSRAL